MSHVTHMNQSCHTYERGWYSRRYSQAGVCDKHVTSFICVTLFTRVWRDSFMCFTHTSSSSILDQADMHEQMCVSHVTSFIPVWHGSFIHVWHGSFIHVWHGSFIHVWHGSILVRHGSFIHVRHGSFIHVTHYMCVSHTSYTYTFISDQAEIHELVCVCGVCVCVTCRCVCVCQMSHREYVWYRMAKTHRMP